LAPDFLVAHNLHSVLSESAGGDSADEGGRHTIEINNSEVGHMSLTYRTEQVKRRYVDEESDKQDELVLDEHGRPLELLYGVVSRHQPPSTVDERDLQWAREEAVVSYRRFLGEEDTFQIDASRSFLLHGSKASVPGSDADPRPSERPSDIDVVKPVGEITRPLDDRLSKDATGSPRTPTQADRRKSGVGGATVIVVALLIAAFIALLVLLWMNLISF
jgi:hypothetical protein